MTGTHESFAFEDGGRTFTCEVATLGRAMAESWWWFVVSSEDRQRYAPFRAELHDTQATVRGRVIAYYEHLLARRAEPARTRWQRGGYTRPGAPVAVEAAAPPA